MAQNETDWLSDGKTIVAKADYTDASATPELNVKPSDSDSLENAASRNAQQILTKMYGKDVRAALAQWILLSGYILGKSTDSLQEMQTIIKTFQHSIDGRVTNVEGRMTTQEDIYRELIAELTDTAGTEGAAELIQARKSDLYGDYPTVDARFEAIEARMAPVIPGGFDIRIDHGAGRNPDSVIVDYYTDALGTELNGLGTSTLGLGGSSVQTLTASVSTPSANAIVVTLPVAFKVDGTPELHDDGLWYVIEANKILRFKLLGADGEPINSSPKSEGGDDGSNVPATPQRPSATLSEDMRSVVLEWSN